MGPVVFNEFGPLNLNESSIRLCFVCRQGALWSLLHFTSFFSWYGWCIINWFLLVQLNNYDQAVGIFTCRFLTSIINHMLNTTLLFRSNEQFLYDWLIEFHNESYRIWMYPIYYHIYDRFPLTSISMSVAVGEFITFTSWTFVVLSVDNTT